VPHQRQAHALAASSTGPAAIGAAASLSDFLTSTDEADAADREARLQLHAVDYQRPVYTVRRYTRLIHEMRRFLRTKLPAYAVPTLFVPLLRMPLTPNGKVDKNALPFPESAYDAPAGATPPIRGRRRDRRERLQTPLLLRAAPFQPHAAWPR